MSDMMVQTSLRNTDKFPLWIIFWKAVPPPDYSKMVEDFFAFSTFYKFINLGGRII